MNTCDVVPFQVNPFQCADFSEFFGEDRKVVVCQVDIGQVLHLGHTVGKFSQNVALQVQLCNDKNNNKM